MSETPNRAETPADVPIDDPFDEWRRLREARGRRVTIIDLYRLVATRRGLEPRELPLSEREELGRRALAVMYEGFERTVDSHRGREPIEVVPYDYRWPALFQRWKARLAEALRGTAIRIEHVGSTSIPGLAAKPVIDIQVSVANLSDEAAYVPPLTRLGVQLRSRDVEHRYFRPFRESRRETHIHVCQAGSAWEREHLLFRDYLRATPPARRSYEQLKTEAAIMWRDDRMAYTEAKTGLILDISDEANAWADATGWTLDRRLS